MSELYNVLNRTIGKIKDTNDMLSCCQQDVTYLHNRLSPKVHGIHIKSTNNVVTLSIKCNNIVKCLTPYDYRVITAVGGMQSVTIENVTGDIFLDNTDSILELDIHDQGITSIEIFSAYNLNKLVLYDNDITVLDLSHCPNLQFLHIHNNPICDNDTYIDNLIECMYNLTDRAMFSTGSIILYPWYGLEVLICKDPDGTYIKYPSGRTTLTLEDGLLYGLVEGDSITYCTYDGNELVTHIPMNRHHSIRKELEKNICLKKNWIFGSAIMYSDDWDNCTWDFRKNNIADMWETAEKGFGLTLGSMDKFTNTLPGFNSLNISDTFRHLTGVAEDELPDMLDYTDSSNWDSFKDGSDNDDQLTHELYIDGEYTHGDSMLSISFGTAQHENTKDKRMGYIPNCCVALCDNMSPSGFASIPIDGLGISLQRLTKQSDAVSLPFVLDTDDTQRLSEVRTLLGEYGENNILCVSAGNGGDGLPYSTESNGKFSLLAGNYSTLGSDGAEVIKKSNTLFVGSCDGFGLPSTFSNCSVDANLMGIDRDNYLLQYGDAIPVWKNIPDSPSLRYESGTSYSCQSCVSVLLLMKNIYKKMFPQETSFGGLSNFMSHVHKRWSTHSDYVMDNAVGYGIPNILAEPYAPCLLSEEPTIKYGSEVTLGNPIRIDYNKNNPYSKSGYTAEYNYDNISIADDGKIYPLKTSDQLDIKIHSNSSKQSPDDYSYNYYSDNMTVKVIDCIVDCPPDEITEVVPVSKYSITTDNMEADIVKCEDLCNDNTEFTVQFAIDLSDKLHPQDSGTYIHNRELLYMYSGNELGYLGLNNLSYTKGDSKVRFTDKTSFVYDYYSSPDSREELLPVSTSIGWGIRNYAGMDDSTCAIITLTHSGDGLKVYYNGSYIGGFVDVKNLGLKVSGIYVNMEYLCHDSTACVRMFDRVLTHKEIIQNTISMLNDHSDEVTE